MKRALALAIVVALALACGLMPSVAPTPTDVAPRAGATDGCGGCGDQTVPHGSASQPLATTDDVLAELGYEVTGEARATVSTDPADAAWVRPAASLTVRRHALVPRGDASGSRAEDDTGMGTRPAPAAPATAGEDPGVALRPIPHSYADYGAARRVRDGVVLLLPSLIAGQAVRQADHPDGVLRITNVSGGDYSVQFSEPVRVDGLLIPANTDIPVLGLLEIRLRADAHLVIQPHASAWPQAPLPDGVG